MIFLEQIEHQGSFSELSLPVTLPLSSQDLIVSNTLSFKNEHILSYSDFAELAGCCEEVVICKDLKDDIIPIYCDLRVRMKRFKVNDDETAKQLLVGKTVPVIEFTQGELIIAH